MLELIRNWPGAALLRQTSEFYILVNASHILSIGILAASALLLDLRLLGIGRTVPLRFIGPYLERAAVIGVGLAVLTGAWLFSVRPDQYAGNIAFLAKIALIAIALANAASVHFGAGWRRAIADDGIVGPGLKFQAGVSIALWLGVLLAGRWIGFLD